MYNPEMFMPLPPEERASAEIMRPSLTYWQDAGRRLVRDPLAVLGLIVIVVILVMAVFGPMVSQYEYDAQDFMVSNEPPSASHWFGGYFREGALWSANISSCRFSCECD